MEGPYVKVAKVGLLLAGQDLERGGLANAVGPDQAEHLARARRRQPARAPNRKRGSVRGRPASERKSARHAPVQLERVAAVAVRRGLFQVGRQVDHHDGLERALLHADAASNAQLLRDEGDLGLELHLDAEPA